MIQKIVVGLQQKVGQPNFGSLGASCSVELQLDDRELQRPEQVAARVKQAFDQCRESIERELNGCVMEAPPRSTRPADSVRERSTKPVNNRATSGRRSRTATEAQVRAIRAIASKAGLSLASALEQGFGVRRPDDLTIQQASQLIDSMKQNLSPSPA